MKAYVRPIVPTALVWGIAKETEEFAKLETIFTQFHLLAKAVGSAQAGCQVAYLCGMPGASMASQLLFVPDNAYPPALILYGLSDAALDNLLEKLATSGIAIPLKCVVTSTNKVWPLHYLLAQLQQEHAQLSHTDTEQNT